MNRKIISAIFAILLACVLALSVYAEEKLGYVTDMANLLTDEERQSLEEGGRQLAEKYNMGVYIITADDIWEYVDAPDIETAAETLYLEYELGKGENHDGILLLLDMNTRQWAIFAFGYGNTAFTDYGKEYLSGFFLDNFGEDNWCAGMQDYQEVCGEMIDCALDGDPVDTYGALSPVESRIVGVIACILLSFIPAFIVKMALLSQLESVNEGSDANEFMSSGGLVLENENDVFVQNTVQTVYSPKDKSSGSDDKKGGTTVRKSGGSSKSGRF